MMNRSRFSLISGYLDRRTRFPMPLPKETKREETVKIRATVPLTFTCGCNLGTAKSVLISFVSSCTPVLGKTDSSISYFSWFHPWVLVIPCPWYQTPCKSPWDYRGGHMYSHELGGHMGVFHTGLDYPIIIPLSSQYYPMISSPCVLGSKHISRKRRRNYSRQTKGQTTNKAFIYTLCASY